MEDLSVAIVATQIRKRLSELVQYRLVTMIHVFDNG
jgi:hypothetical protein